MSTTTTIPAGEAQLFARAWHALHACVDALTTPDFERPSGCQGWRVRDLLCHLVIDAQDVLITLATPTPDPATADAVSYWSIVDPPSGEDPLDALIPRLATAYGDPGLLTFHLDDVGSAACRAALLADPDRHVVTQEMVLPVREFLRAYVLEWTLHQLDLRVAVPALPDPPTETLAEARHQVELVTGWQLPTEFDDAAVLQVVTGRRPPTVAESALLGPERAAQLPRPIG